MSEFEYEVRYWLVTASQTDALSQMVKEIEQRFNTGWKPTTNGPAMTMPMMPMSYVEEQVWFVMYVFAKEKVHHDA